MISLTRALLLVAVGASVTGAAQDVEPVPPVTVAESSEYARTGTHADVVAFLDTLADQSDRVHRMALGTSQEGLELPLAVIAEPAITSPEQARKSKKTMVLLLGNIHAGEVAGKEALQMLARELALGEDPGVLDELIVAIAPIYNADGNEPMAPDNRPGQVGPDEMGRRANAQGLDLNRDYVKLRAPETRALVRFLTEWDPAVVVDTHTTNGSHHRYVLTYQGPKHPAGDAEVLEYVRDTMLPEVDAAFEDATGEHAFFYGNFSENHTKWTTYPAEPRYGVAYRGLRNRLSILTEAYAYASYERRVGATRAFCREILRYTAEHSQEIAELVRAADRRTVEAGRDPTGSSMIAVRNEPIAFPDAVTVLGYQEYDDEGNRTDPGEPRDYAVEFVNDFVATERVARPYAYLLDAGMKPIARVLQRHGIRVEVLREDLELDTEVYRLGRIERAGREFEGHTLVTDVAADAIPSTTRAEAGMYVVRTGQKLGTLAAYLLEPRASDGLVAWNFFDDHLQPDADFPAVRIPRRSPMVLRDARALPEDRTAPKRITYEVLYGGDRRPDLDGSVVGGLTWVDDLHYLQRKDGELRKVHAVTGRSEPAEVDAEAIAARLAALPTVDAAAAGKLARRFARPDPERAGVVFTHGGDLYFAGWDGSGARRLTSSPQADELAQLSPDGAFVAFVRDNDLWVVDVATATERQLTTGGRDDYRHGKASWVYFEEILRRNWRSFWWSPDSRHIAYTITDSAGVPEFTIIDDAVEPQRIETTRYPKPGDTNPHVEVAVVPAIGGAPTLVDLSDYDHGAYLVTQVTWSEHHGTLRLAIQDRAQTWLDLLEIKPGQRTARRLFRDRTDAWVEPLAAPAELADGSFLWQSERDGWRHLYHYDARGTLLGRVTEGDYEVRRLHHVDEEGGWVYFEGTVDTHIASNLYRARLDGSGQPVRLTPEAGSHRIAMSPNAKLFVDTWSSHDQPPRAALRSAAGTRIRMLDINPVFELEAYELAPLELHTIESSQGHPLEAAIIYPPEFDPAGSYPVWFRTYAGPHAPTIRDTWSGGRAFDQMLAAMGIVVLLGEPYSASGKGARSAWTAYKRLGEAELADIEDLIDWIAAKPWADAERIGMSGHSYGGFMTGYALTHSEKFSAGIAGAPVTSWRDYDSIYTERYMHTPQNNPEGYANTSVVDAAENLHGRLLLLHGTMDDNVHMQNSIKLVDALRKAEKQFDLFIYPGYRHGIFNKHYNRLVYEFIRDTMRPARPADAPPGGQPEPEESPGRQLESEQDEPVITGPGPGR